MKQAMWRSVMLGVGVLAALAAGGARAEEAAAEATDVAAEAPAQDAPWFIKKYDADGDGAISDSERETAKAAWKEKQQKRDLKKFDKDGDGQLSADEQAAADAARAARKQKMLERFDKDGDGKLNEAERAEMTKHWADRKDGPHDEAESAE